MEEASPGRRPDVRDTGALRRGEVGLALVLPSTDEARWAALPSVWVGLGGLEDCSEPCTGGRYLGGTLCPGVACQLVGGPA